jgi:hypothetical protein
VASSTRRLTSTTAEASANRDQILMLLGELRESVVGLREDVAEIKAEAGNDRRDASESRRRIYQKLDDGEKRLMKMESTVRVIGGVVEKQGQRVSELEPTVNRTAGEVRRWTMLGAFIGTGVIALGGFVAWIIQSNGAALWNALIRLLKGD